MSLVVFVDYVPRFVESFPHFGYLYRKGYHDAAQGMDGVYHGRRCVGGGLLPTGGSNQAYRLAVEVRPLVSSQEL